MLGTGPEPTLIAAFEARPPGRPTLVVAIGVFTVADLPPFATVMDLGAVAREAWSADGGYERKTVGEVCAQLELSLEEGLARLRRHGMEATPETPMKSLADRHGRHPHDLLQILASA